jgi:hypothetical protein
MLRQTTTQEKVKPELTSALDIVGVKRTLIRIQQSQLRSLWYPTIELERTILRRDKHRRGDNKQSRKCVHIDN